MKIKTKKEFNLLEMIQHIMDNKDLRSKNFSPKIQEGRVKVSHFGNVFVENVSVNDTFVVEVEEEMTEETFLKDVELIGLARRRYRDGADYEMCKWSLSPDTKKINISGLKDLYDLKSLHKINDDGSWTLLYTEENGIVKP